MSRLKIAAQLILDNEHQMANDMLSRGQESYESYYWRSLLCRLNDKYDEEKDLVEKCKNLFGSSQYMDERSKWHKQTEFEKMVPRQPLRLPRNPQLIPENSVIEQTCFVTGGDAKYFEFMVEFIESARATTLYKDVAICILDCGLTDDQKHYLKNILKVSEIKETDWQYKVEGFRVCDQNDPKGRLTPLIPGYKTIMSSAFLKDIFPDYRFIFWFDADSWIHDERSIDRHLDLCLQQGVAFPLADRTPFKNRLVFKFPVIKDQYKQKLADSLHIASNQWVVDSESGFFEDWKKYMDIHCSGGEFWRAVEEETAMIVMHERGTMKMLDERDILMLYAYGMPVVKDDSQTLYHPINGQPVGIMPMIQHKFTYYWPTHKVSSCLNPQQLQQHTQLYYQCCQALNQGQKDPCTLAPQQPKVSQRFRVYPWKDKPEIISLLKKEAIACQS